MKKVILIAAFDSQLKWCKKISDEFENRNYQCRIIIPKIRSALSEKQIHDAGFSDVERVSWNETVSIATNADIVVTALSGPKVIEFLFKISDYYNNRNELSPIIISGWVGVIFEKQIEGYLDRFACDIVVVNSVDDYNNFKEIAWRLNLPEEPLTLAGLPFLPSYPLQGKEKPIQRVLFADQPTVPSMKKERLYLYDKLIAYAQAYPDREVILKPRHKKGEDTFHKMAFHPEDLIDTKRIPKNFKIDYTPISEILHTVDLLITMSSTASLEAIASGCRVALPLDLGVNEKYGNHVFLNSGLLKSFSQISKDDIGNVTTEFLNNYFLKKEQNSYEIIVDKCEVLLESDMRYSKKAWSTDYFLNRRKSSLGIEIIKNKMKQQKWKMVFKYIGKKLYIL
ncbi:DUF6716 putative glycosyltransferase [Polycladidibacter stylochi]|uniref:DUF6716 putative glycosyltransferase n=1 Tax=Polycladidibacter stylochi TaxID=1807766 RepID=UPI00083536B7|nr:DUF6716 putative glycosyltransferase [Pseudovibrio stylochi]